MRDGAKIPHNFETTSHGNIECRSHNSTSQKRFVMSLWSTRPKNTQIWKSDFESIS